ncbi:hypothetical protein DPMN_088040 [Dreissena polymorpha]|uniref:Uncharacterized protein n=1 Tax=Dreissena polymorpha TaxID=45954 RepID=A0A9D4KTE8_DREPO|nr:hypothetical protein DPMN_088040 [Dreissena polymorpha]
MRKLPPPPSSHVIQLTGTIFELNSHVRDINKTNVLTNFHDDWAKFVTSIVFRRENCHYIHIEKNAPATGGHVFSPIWTIFELVREINKTNVLTNFHDDWATIGTSRVFTTKTDPPPFSSHVFQLTGTIFELNSHIIKTNILTNCELNRDFIGTKLLTKFHEDWTINVVSRVFTNKCGRTTDGQLTKTGHKSSPEQSGKLPHPPGSHVFLLIRTICKLICDIYKTNLFTKKLPPCSHIIQLTGTIFELNSCINETNVLTKFHENWAKNVTSRKTAPPPSSHVIQLTGTIFELNSHIKETNALSKFHENWAKNVTSTVFTCFHYIHIQNNDPPTGSLVFSPIPTIFKDVRDINKTNVLTTFHDDWAKFVTSIVFRRENCHYIHINQK